MSEVTGEEGYFPSLRSLKSVQFDPEADEIHALMVAMARVGDASRRMNKIESHLRFTGLFARSPLPITWVIGRKNALRF
ncbi:hypothetical protein [Shimia sp. NS0008-38b]|uniref:hypothetical protein n=1 Tax=Shimia sp. NS0008-38b TaxID=3127653 RepID=UPI003340B3C8